MNSRHALVETALGELTLVAADERLIGLYFPNQRNLPGTTVLGTRVDVSDDSLLSEASAQLLQYLEGTRGAFDLPVSARGDAFQHSVWDMLHDIPYGATTTYGELAERLGNKSLAQNVGRAVGQNPLCIIVPCHRVVGSGGKLTGYAGGLERKSFLLEMEEPAAAHADKLF
jgi:methylated-DNA-[protein]-cysteine S-methyltransferase